MRKVPVDIFAKQFHGGPIAGAIVADLHTEEGWETGEDGLIRVNLAPGRLLTPVFYAEGFPAVQSASVVIPPRGLAGPDREITFEVPSLLLYGALTTLFGNAAEDTRHVVTTVLRAGANLRNNYGEKGAQVYLVSESGRVRKDAFYLGATPGKNGGKHKTSWTSALLSRNLSSVFGDFGRRIAGEKATTIDGGAIFPDVPFGRYEIIAEKEGVQFSVGRTIISPSSPSLINVSPPHGPRARFAR